MSNHYSYYLKKSISARDLVFDKVKERDKDVLSRVRKAYIRANTGGLILLVIAFVVSSWIFYNFLTAKVLEEASFSLLQESRKTRTERTPHISIFSISIWKIETNLL